MQLLFLDTETTGLTPQDRLIQVAYKTRPGFSPDDLPESAYFRPDCPISFEAMMVNHITTEMILDKPTFQGSPEKKFLDEAAKDFILIAHNAKFDMGILEREGVKFPLWIDSQRVAKHLIDSKRYNLQYLRYSLGLNSNGMAHDASGDVQVLEKLFDFMLQKIKDDMHYNDEQAIDHMVTLSIRPALVRRFFFGKHKDENLKEVANYDRSYLSWLYNSEMTKPESDRDEDMIFTLQQYLTHQPIPNA